MSKLEEHTMLGLAEDCARMRKALAIYRDRLNWSEVFDQEGGKCWCADLDILSLKYPWLIAQEALKDTTNEK